MTTIVYNHKSKQIAIDSRMTSGNIIISDSVDKGFFIGDRLFFLCGDSFDIIKFKECYPDIKRNYDCYGLMLYKGLVYNIGFDGKHLKEVAVNFDISCGSGEEFALSAMDFGRTAKEAIEYAMTRDTYTGGKVHVYDIEKGKFI